MLDDDGNRANLATRMARMEAHQGILDTMHRYGHSVDRGPEQEWLDCFTEDGVFDIHNGGADVEQRYEGRDALAGFIGNSHRHSRSRPSSMHFLDQPIIMLNGDEAKVQSNHGLLAQSPTGETHIRFLGFYRDTLVRCPDGRWRFKERIADVRARFDK